MAKIKNKIKTNQGLLNQISPFGVEFYHRDMIFGENFAKMFLIVKFPSSLAKGWLAKFTNIKGAIVTSIFVPQSESIIVNGISKSISANRAKSMSSKDSYERIQADRRADDGEKILEQIDKNGEKVGKIINVIMATGSNKDSLKKVSDKIKSTAIGLGCNIRDIPFLQEEGYKTVSPYDILPELIEKLGGRPCLLSTYFGGFFASSDGLNDNSGYYFARDNDNRLIILDMWKRGNDRTNSNMTILGASGKGKSTAVKKIILNEYMLGTKILIIDPEREYDEIVKSLDGDVINLGGSQKGKLNPFEIKPLSFDDNDDNKDDEYDGLGALALHLQGLEVFFSLYLEISERQKALLNEILVKLYKEFNIDWDTDITNLKNTDFPIMQDLYNLVNKKSIDFKSRNIDAINDYEELKILLTNCSTGADSFLFNGYTNLKTDNSLVCLDTHDLNNASDRVKKTQYFNIITWCWKQITNNRKEKIMLICDEAYLLIDPKIPQTLIGLKNIAKRGRKYEGSLVVVSQSIVDFLAPEVKTNGQAVLNQACYKIFLGSDGKDLEEIVDTFELKDTHKDMILSGTQGRGLIKVGSRFFGFNLELTEFEASYIIGGKGGR